MKNHCQMARLASLVVLTLVTVLAMTTPSSATGNIVKADLAGPWQVSLILSNSGCGPMSILVNFTLNSNGSASNATLVSHSGCGDSTLPGQTFTINTLNANGSGTAGLSCGSGCGWSFNIQVAPDRSTFNLVDVSSANPGNYVEGIAIHQ
jgi:hypothetical protein